MAPIFELVAAFLEVGEEIMFREDEMGAWVASVALALGVNRNVLAKVAESVVTEG
jgi:transposase-like protein